MGDSVDKFNLYEKLGAIYGGDYNTIEDVIREYDKLVEEKQKLKEANEWLEKRLGRAVKNWTKDKETFRLFAKKVMGIDYE